MVNVYEKSSAPSFCPVQELGVNLGTAMRMQINVMVRKTSLLSSYTEHFEDETILPLLWLETVSAAFPHPFIRIARSFTVRPAYLFWNPRISDLRQDSHVRSEKIGRPLFLCCR